MRSLKIKPEALIGLVYKDSEVMKQHGRADVPDLGTGHPKPAHPSPPLLSFNAS